MNKRKKLITVLMVIAAVLLICVGLYLMPKSFGKGVDAKRVHHINVFDGNTGEGFTVDDPAQIRHIVENIQSIPMHRDGISMGRMGYGFKISYIDENDRDVVPLFFMNSDNTIRKDPFFYRCEGGLGFDYLKELETEILNTVPSLLEIAQNSDKELQDTLRGFSAEEIHAKWGEPNWELFGFWGDIYHFPGSDRAIILYYDANGIINNIKTDYQNESAASYGKKQIDNNEEHDEIDQSLSIGIIGGADGPTAIFVTGSVNWPKMIAFLGGLAVLIVVGIVLIKKKRSKE